MPASPGPRADQPPFQRSHSSVPPQHTPSACMRQSPLPPCSTCRRRRPSGQARRRRQPARAAAAGATATSRCLTSSAIFVLYSSCDGNSSCDSSYRTALSNNSSSWAWHSLANFLSLFLSLCPSPGGGGGGGDTARGASCICNTKQDTGLSGGGELRGGGENGPAALLHASTTFPGLGGILLPTCPVRSWSVRNPFPPSPFPRPSMSRRCGRGGGRDCCKG